MSSNGPGRSRRAPRSAARASTRAPDGRRGDVVRRSAQIIEAAHELGERTNLAGNHSEVCGASANQCCAGSARNSVDPPTAPTMMSITSAAPRPRGNPRDEAIPPDGQHQRQEQGEGDRDERDVPDIKQQADRARHENAYRGDLPAGGLVLAGPWRPPRALGPYAILFLSRPGEHLLLEVLAVVFALILGGRAPLNRSGAQQASVGRGRPAGSTARRWPLVHNAHMQAGRLEVSR